MSFTDRFRGLRALVRSKRDLLWVSFVIALVGGFVFGLGERAERRVGPCKKQEDK